MSKKKTAGNSPVVKAVAIEKEFFSRVDQLNDQTLSDATPALVKMLQRYDRLLGFSPTSNFATAIDVRLFYAVFGRLKTSDPKTRREIMKGTDDCFTKGQLHAIDRARLTLITGTTQELKPAALMPVLRAGF